MKIKIKIPCKTGLHDKTILSYHMTYEKLIVNVGQTWAGKDGKINYMPYHNKLIVNVGDRWTGEDGKNMETVIMSFTFTDVIGVKDVPTNELTDFAEETGKDDFLDKSLSINYAAVPKEHPYKIYVFYDLDDSPCMEVIAADVKIENKNNES